MDDYKPDIKADIIAASEGHDRGELVNNMEPPLIAKGSRYRTVLTDLALDLAARSAGLGRSLPEGLLAALSKLVRAMNCYYSNLIEGHDTHPFDIERALNNDYSTDTVHFDWNHCSNYRNQCSFLSEYASHPSTATNRFGSPDSAL